MNGLESNHNSVKATRKEIACDFRYLVTFSCMYAINMNYLTGGGNIGCFIENLQLVINTLREKMSYEYLSPNSETDAYQWQPPPGGAQ